MLQDVTTRFLLSVEEAARKLSLSRMTVYRLMRLPPDDPAYLPSVKIGFSRRVSVATLQAYVDRLEAQRDGTTG